MRGAGAIDAVGHRIVHGGTEFIGPVLIERAACCGLAAAFVLILAGCGGGGKKAETDTGASGAAKTACDGSALSTVSKPPSGFPTVQSVTHTKQSAKLPTDVIEGYFMGSVKDAHHQFKKAPRTGGYTVLHDELDEHDSAVNWKGAGRTGQVAVREQCGENDKIYVHITNRPA